MDATTEHLLCQNYVNLTFYLYVIKQERVIFSLVTATWNNIFLSILILLSLILIMAIREVYIFQQANIKI